MLEQIWAVLLISQIWHALQLEIAARAGVDPFDVSLPLLVEYLPRWRDVDILERIVMRGRETGVIRPSRRIRIQAPNWIFPSIIPHLQNWNKSVPSGMPSDQAMIKLEQMGQALPLPYRPNMESGGSRWIVRQTTPVSINSKRD